jgi:regulatory protein
MAPRPASIKVRALQWLAQREHSRNELRDKLLRLLHAGNDPSGPDPDRPDAEAEVETLLQWLETHGYLSQARFVESRVHARQSRFGNLRIRQELQQHGVTLDDEAQRALQQTELERATEVWRKKFGAPAVDAAARVRQLRFLAGRGFSMDVVRRVVGRGGAPLADES